MLPTTHIAASCLLTAYTLKSGMEPGAQVLALSGGSLLLHFALDIIPHGYIATSETIFKDPVVTLIEIIPGPVILLAAILVFGNPFLFLLASFFGMLPDLVTTFYSSKQRLAKDIPFIVPIHSLHRKIHWFEEDHSDGSYTFMFPKNPLLVCEALFLTILLVVLFCGTFA